MFIKRQTSRDVYLSFMFQTKPAYISIIIQINFSRYLLVETELPGGKCKMDGKYCFTVD